MTQVGFAILGCGMIADYHARAIADIPNARLFNTYDLSEERARKLAQAHDAEWSTDLAAVLAS